MRILLDECVDESLRRYFPNHDCQSARYAGFKGLQNGKLMLAAQEAGFEVLVTVDQKLPSQQESTEWRLAVILLKARTTDLDDLLPLVPAALAALESLLPGQVVRIES